MLCRVYGGKKLNVKAKEPTPTSIVERSTDFKIIESLSMYENVQNFTKACRMTEKDRTTIFNNTISQDWNNERKGRITASKFHSVCTRTVSLQASATQDPTALVSSLLSYNKVPATAAVKHGCSMEIHAKHCYYYTTKAKKLALKVKKQKLSPVYLCGLCKKEVVEKPTKFSEESISCDKCPLWYHFTCVGIKEGHKIKGKWYCAKCN